MKCHINEDLSFNVGIWQEQQLIEKYLISLKECKTTKSMSEFMADQWILESEKENCYKLYFQQKKEQKKQVQMAKNAQPKKYF